VSAIARQSAIVLDDYSCSALRVQGSCCPLTVTVEPIVPSGAEIRVPPRVTYCAASLIRSLEFGGAPLVPVNAHVDGWTDQVTLGAEDYHRGRCTASI
jgi:hypothetical protein